MPQPPRPERVAEKAVFFVGFLAACSVYPYIGLIYREVIGLDKDEIGLLTSLTPFVALVSTPLFTSAADAAVAWATRRRHHPHHLQRQPAAAATAVLPTILAVAVTAAAATYWGLALPGLTLPGAAAVVAVQAFFQTPVFPLMDAVVLQMLGPRNVGMYGRQRLYGAVACGLTFALSGAAVAASGSLLAVLAANSVWSLAHVACLAWVAFRRDDGDVSWGADDGGENVVYDTRESAAPADNDDDDESSHHAPLLPPQLPDSAPGPGRSLRMADFGFLLRSDSLIFLACLAVLGSAFAVVQSFLWIYLTEERGAGPLLLGLTGPFSVAVELPFFFYAERAQILETIGLQWSILLGHAAMVLRLLLYTVLPSGRGTWLVLGVELLH
ncbi:hypothetical protein HK405_012822, partial [Cladochytrium tenue]